MGKQSLGYHDVLLVHTKSNQFNRYFGILAPDKDSTSTIASRYDGILGICKHIMMTSASLLISARSKWDYTSALG